MSSELLEILGQIEREKDIKSEDLLKTVEVALKAAVRKHLHSSRNVDIEIDTQTGEIKAWHSKKVVNEVSNPEIDISLDDARAIDPQAEIEQYVKIRLEISSFGRIAAETAKQVIIQRLREMERENIYREFKKKEGEMSTGTVQRFLQKAVVIDLGKAEAILPMREQVYKERYEIGERIKIYILQVNQTTKGPQIIVSRTHPGLIRKLFELEVPEIYDQVVEIKNVAREPGRRCKIAVSSNKSKVDPVGACVGIKGSRIRAIIDELKGEKIDIVNWNEDAQIFIAHALLPAKVDEIRLDHDNKKAFVLVDDDQLSLSIGKSGQNVRIAARLTGWHIDVESKVQHAKACQEKEKIEFSILVKLPGVGKKMAEELIKHKLATLEEINNASIEYLTQVPGIGEKKAIKIREAAKKMLA